MSFVSDLVNVGLGTRTRKSITDNVTLSSVPSIPLPLLTSSSCIQRKRLPPEIWTRIFLFVKRDVPPASEAVPWKKLHQNDLTVVMRVNSLFHDLAGAILYHNVTIGNPSEFLFGLHGPTYISPNPFKVNPNRRLSKEHLLAGTRTLTFVDILAASLVKVHSGKYKSVLQASTRQFEGAIADLDKATQQGRPLSALSNLQTIIIRRPISTATKTKALTTPPHDGALETQRLSTIGSFIGVIMNRCQSNLLNVCSQHNDPAQFSIIKYFAQRWTDESRSPTYSFHARRLNQLIHLPCLPSTNVNIYLDGNGNRNDNSVDIHAAVLDLDRLSDMVSNCQKVIVWLCNMAQYMIGSPLLTPWDKYQKENDKYKRFKTRAAFHIIRKTILEIHGLEVTPPPGMEDLDKHESGAKARAEFDHDRNPASNKPLPSCRGKVVIYGRWNTKAMDILKVAVRHIQTSEDLPIWKHAKFEFREEKEICPGCGC